MEWAIPCKSAVVELIFYLRNKLLDRTYLRIYIWKILEHYFHLSVTSAKESITLQHSIEKRNRQVADRKLNYASGITIIFQSSYPLPPSISLIKFILKPK